MNCYSFISPASLTHSKWQASGLSQPHFPAHGLPLLLGDENKVSLVGLGALEPLCQLITHMNRLVRRNAFMALSIMAGNGASDNIQNQCRTTRTCQMIECIEISTIHCFRWLVDLLSECVIRLLTLFYISISRRSKGCSEKNRCHSINHWQTVTWRWVIWISSWIDW